MKKIISLLFFLFLMSGFIGDAVGERIRFIEGSGSSDDAPQSIGGSSYSADSGRLYLTLDGAVYTSNELKMKFRTFHLMRPLKQEPQEELYYVGKRSAGRVTRSSWWRTQQVKRIWKSKHILLRVTQLTTLPVRDGVASLSALKKAEKPPAVTSWESAAVKKWISVYLNRRVVSVSESNEKFNGFLLSEVKAASQKKEVGERLFLLQRKDAPDLCYLVEFSFDKDPCKTEDVDAVLPRFFRSIELL